VVKEVEAVKQAVKQAVKKVPAPGSGFRVLGSVFRVGFGV
jgi:hypothetical protein